METDAVTMALLDHAREGEDEPHDELELDGDETESDTTERPQDGASEANDDYNSVAAFYRDTPGSTLPHTPVSAQAPPFAAVHRTWEEFDTQLKSYSQGTYQLYVVRTTTSVNRRNLRIAELAATTGSSTVDTAEDDEVEQDGRRTDQSDRQMIPAHWKWYSKTMMCTHGWKDRHRGTGKRSMTMVRSTGCPVKMCITLQHTNEVADDEDDDGWRVIVTKHVRTHNHPLSKELYLFYTENRRIYDPELLALVGGNSPSGAMLGAEFYGAFGDDEDENALGNPGAPGPDDTASTGVSAPLMTVKAFSSWDHFHDVLADYSLTTQQHFRIRSTISTQSKNAKLLEQATKAGKSTEDISIHLVPDGQKWYSKLLICNHGWKRKSRSKMQRRGSEGGWNGPNQAPCPAMVMARLQRDIHDKWRIVINRQIINHNHSLYPVDSSEGDQDVRLVDNVTSDPEEGATTDTLMNPPVEVHKAGSTTDDEQYEDSVSVAAAVQHLGDLIPKSSTATSEQEQSQDELIPAPSVHACESPITSVAEVQAIPRPVSVVTEVVVRVAKLPVIHVSWEAFHECLQQYSESTYQSYRTRTTSSVAGRNQKIMEMRANSGNAIDNLSGEGDEESENVSDTTRLIPEHYKWYSKTLTCTHGWKERRRGAGKRTIHVVRSTLCPVKICATLQFLESDSTNSGEVGWRVVVTKHIIDHNHNLSKELYQYYRDNRRIYDPALLAIDQNQVNAPEMVDSSSHSVPNSAVASRRQGPGTLESVPMGEDQASLFPGGPPDFDQTDAFNAQHVLPESAYLVPNPVNPNQHVVLMPNGVTLASFASVPTATVQPSATSTLYGPSTGMHQMFAHGSMFPSSSYSAQLSSNTSQGTPTLHEMCMVHGTSKANQTSEVEGAACTCPRNANAHNYLSGGSSDPIATRNGGKRQSRNSEFSHDGVIPSSKRVRHDSDSLLARSQDRQSDTFIVSAAAGTTGTTNSSDSSAEVWSIENPIQAISVTESDGTVVWRAPRLKRRHENWVEFTDHLNAYCGSTYQLYRVRTTSSISARNNRISQHLQQLQEEGGRLEHQNEEEFVPHLIPASFEWYSKTYVCTHGWKERRRGKGQRVSHNLRSTACPVKVCATLQRDPLDTANWNVVVTKHVLDHNHEISQQLYQSYSENRRIKDPQLLAQAEQMWREGQPRRNVFEFLKGATKSIIVMKDVHNLVQRWQQQHESSTTTQPAAVSQPPHGDEPEPDLDLIV